MTPIPPIKVKYVKRQYKMDIRDKGKTGNSRKAYKFDEIVEQSWAEHIQY